MTQEQAQVLALACLTKRWSGTLGRIREREVLERGFGWVFSIESTTEDTPMDQGQPPHLVLINKRSQQVVVTSGPHSAVSFAHVYEALLARSVKILSGSPEAPLCSRSSHWNW